MIVRFASNNDCKAVWMWMNDRSYTPFNTIDLDYEKYKKWFDLMFRKNAIVIGVSDNLRVGMAFSTLIHGRTYIKCLIKPAYCGYLGSEFVHQACKFISSELQEDVYVELPKNKASLKEYSVSGLSELCDSVFVYGQPM